MKALSLILSVIAAVGLYPRTGYIVELSTETVVIEDATGLLWEIENDADDWCVGDGVSMIMYDNGTEDSICDDCVVVARYSGFWR